MRIAFASVCLTTVATLSISLAGCGSESSADKTPAADSGHYEGDGHDHGGEETGHFEGDGHEHGDDEALGHPTEGPHGGHLIELGNEEYHAELLHDEATHTVAIHLLDSAGKQPVAVPLPEITVQLFRDGQFVKYALKAVNTSNAVEGSEFAIVNEELCETLLHGKDVRGRVQVTVDGKQYIGNIEHVAHDHDGHDH